MWVNLSPYEKDRIIAEGFDTTEMGRDLLAQDYILKQLTASLLYPENELGKQFWNKIYAQAQEKLGTNDIPMDTFNKVWIVPERAEVYVHGKSAFVVGSHLKVMLEEDYLSEQRTVHSEQSEDSRSTVHSPLTTATLKEIIIPEIEKEVNEGKNFAQLRQIYNALILATWYKKNLKKSLFGQMYVDKNKTKGVDVEDKQIKQKIYYQYLAAFKKGAYNYIKEDYDPVTQEVVTKKYISGGVDAAMIGSVVEEKKQKLTERDLALTKPEIVTTEIRLNPSPRDAAMTGEKKQLRNMSEPLVTSSAIVEIADFQINFSTTSEGIVSSLKVRYADEYSKTVFLNGPSENDFSFDPKRHGLLIGRIEDKKNNKKRFSIQVFDLKDSGNLESIRVSSIDDDEIKNLDLKVLHLSSRDLSNQSKSVSAKHAVIRFEGKEAIITDLGSLNGTWISSKFTPEILPEKKFDIIPTDTSKHVKASTAMIEIDSEKPMLPLAEVLPSSEGLGSSALAAVREEFRELLKKEKIINIFGDGIDQEIVRKYAPLYKTSLNGTTYYLSTPMIDENRPFFVCFVYTVNHETNKNEIFVNYIYKSNSHARWRTASNRKPKSHWYGKGRFESDTDVPFEIEKHLEKLIPINKTEIAKNSEAFYEILRESYGVDTQFLRTKINIMAEGRSVAFFEEDEEGRANPASLKFIDGYEPDLEEGVVEEFQVNGGEYYGMLTVYRVFSKKKDEEGAQYLIYVQNGRFIMISSPQPVSLKLKRFGVRADLIYADPLFSMTRVEYTDQIPIKFIGDYLKDGYSDASKWIKEMPIAQEINRKLKQNGGKLKINQQLKQNAARSNSSERELIEPRADSVSDPAMLVTKKTENPGGIDLNPNQMDLQTTGDEVPFYAPFDPAVIKTMGDIEYPSDEYRGVLEGGNFFGELIGCLKL